MRYLIEGTVADAALGQAGARVVERYPSFVLVEAPQCPANVPESACEALDATSISVHGREVELPDGELRLHDAPHALVRFVGPLSPRWRQALRSAGVEVLFWAPPYGACVRFPDAIDVDVVRAKLPFIAGAQPYGEEQCARRIGAPSALVRRDTGALPNTWDLVCFTREMRVRVEDELKRRGIQVLASSSSKLRVRFTGDAAQLRELVGVKLVGPARAPKLASTAALAQAVGLRVGAGAWPDGYDGRGQIVAVADTGLDRGSRDAGALHADFDARVRHLASWPINPSWDDFVDNPRADDGGADEASGHGTYIAGLVLASGAKSNGTHRGIAPAAELVFQAIEQRTEVKPQFKAELPGDHHLAGRPLDLRQLFRQARELGARIHVNAWGDPAGGHYTDDCFEADLFLRECPDAVIVFAAGNDASDRDGNRELDRGSLFAPASAKNVLAIGATEGPLQGVGWRGTWADVDPTGARFRASSQRADALSGEPDRIALFSCTGPTEDGRIKPDLCAPGTNLVAARSQATAAKGWGLASPLPHYMYDGGTSASTGVAGGFFALLRQAWTQARGGVAPSGAALKALAILGAQPVRAHASGGEEARFVAGFGRLDFERCSPRRSDADVRVFDELDPGLHTGEAREFVVFQPSAGALRAVLAWYDAPGERLVNDLDLALVGANGVIAWGNHAAGTLGAPDRVNTVERIDVATLPAGSYVLRVVARNVLEGPQPFALALSLPRAALPDVPVDWISGIGASTTTKLAAAGVADVLALRDLDRAALSAASGVRGASADKLRAKLGVLFQTIAQPFDAAVPRTLTLAEMLATKKPEQLDLATWERARTQLLPLQLVFDKRRLGDIALHRLIA